MDSSKSSIPARGAEEGAAARCSGAAGDVGRRRGEDAVHAEKESSRASRIEINKG